VVAAAIVFSAQRPPVRHMAELSYRRHRFPPIVRSGSTSSNHKLDIDAATRRSPDKTWRKPGATTSSNRAK
jgi:hypothetical protein